MLTWCVPPALSPLFIMSLSLPLSLSLSTWLSPRGAVQEGPGSLRNAAKQAARRGAEQTLHHHHLHRQNRQVPGTRGVWNGRGRGLQERRNRRQGQSLSLSDLAQRRASGLQEIYDSIVVEAVSPEAGGSLQKGDLIVKIETDDIRCWSLARCRHLSPSRLTSSSGPKAERFQSSCSVLGDLYLREDGQTST
jgi:hypothetical protein